MATRLYFSSTGTPSISPAFNTGWEITTGADRRTMSVTKDASALTDKSVTIIDAVFQDYLNRQFVSPPLNAQTITSANLTFVIRCVEANAGVDATTAYSLRSYRPSTTAFQQFNAHPIDPDDQVEYGTSAATRIRSSSGMSTITVAAGDVLVMELGVTPDNASVFDTATQRFGSDNASDFALTSGLTTDLNPWMELSVDITFQPTGTVWYSALI